MSHPNVCIVTGGNSGIGLMTAAGLAKAGAHVVIACRSPHKAEKAVRFLQSSTGNPHVEFLPLDLASFDSIRAFVSQFRDRQLPLHCLVNNAGVFSSRGRTREGFELIWGINYLGHFLLTQLLLEQLQASAPSRIIMTTSDLAFRSTSIPWDRLVQATPWNFVEFYGLSKLCLVLFTVELARRLQGSNVTVNAVHPGFVQSNITLGHRLSQIFSLGRSTEAGALSLLQCATTGDLEKGSGKFFDPQGQELQLPALAEDRELVQQLWQQSCLWTGLEQPVQMPANPYDPADGIWGPYSLSLGEPELAAIAQTILQEVLPQMPGKTFWMQRGWSLLRQGQWGSLLLLMIQGWKQEFHMERHLDSAAVQTLCQDAQLVQTLQEHLGEQLMLWRSELWVNAPTQQLIPCWHQDGYSRLLRGQGKRLHVYIAITEVNEVNGFQYLPLSKLSRQPTVKVTDVFSGNPLYEVTADLEQQAIPVVLKPGEFVLFTDELIHRSTRNSSGRLRLSLTLRVTDGAVGVVSTYSPSEHPSVLLSAASQSQPNSGSGRSCNIER